MARAVQAGERFREDLLPEAAAFDQQEGRQRGGLSPALGATLPLYDRAGRGLDHDWPRAGAARGADGTESGGGIYQTAPRIVNGETLFARAGSHSPAGSMDRCFLLG